MAGAEDEGDDGEGHVEDCPGEGGPEGEEEDDGFGGEEFEGDGEGEVDHVCEGGALFVGENFVAETKIMIGWELRDGGVDGFGAAGE